MRNPQDLALFSNYSLPDTCWLLLLLVILLSLANRLVPFLFAVSFFMLRIMAVRLPS